MKNKSLVESYFVVKRLGTLTFSDFSIFPLTISRFRVCFSCDSKNTLSSEVYLQKPHVYGVISAFSDLIQFGLFLDTFIVATRLQVFRDFVLPFWFCMINLIMISLGY